MILFRSGGWVGWVVGGIDFKAISAKLWSKFKLRLSLATISVVEVNLNQNIGFEKLVFSGRKYRRF